MVHALDASAMLAYLKQETGWEQVAAMLANASDACYAHAVNLCEGYYRTLLESGQPTARQLIQDLISAGVSPREDMDQPFWQDVGDMIAQVRAAPGLSASLADVIGIALARRLECELVTADRKEMTPLLPLGLCQVRFIR
jgi:PIN domain nuclease of toxin-antitoxin system